MEIELIAAGPTDKPVLQALLQLYLYDFSEMVAMDVDDHGQFYYPYLDYYWTEPGRHAFLLRCEGKLAGFALVRTLEFGDDPLYQVAEFFVLRRYRGRGLGRLAAITVFEHFRGRWQVDQFRENTAAQHFWRRVIGDYSGGRYAETWPDGDGPSQRFNNREPV